MENVLSIISVLGVGGLIGSYLTFLLNKSKELEFKRLEQKEKRYKSCLLYMDAFFEPNNLKYLSNIQPVIEDEKDVLEYLKAEYHEMLLYASKDVIFSVKSFIESPTNENFLKAVLTMRQDLWVKGKDFDLKQIVLSPKWNEKLRR
ncbi:MAG: hypothetical protein ABH834_03340 [Candidatus Altiarchaeota archaeon]